MAEKIRSIGSDADEGGEAVREKVEKAKATVAEGVEGARKKLGEVGSEFSAQAGRAGTYARDRVDSARESLFHGVDRARKDLDQLGSDISVFVRDNPGRSVLIAAAFGFVVGYAMRGERR